MDVELNTLLLDTHIVHWASAEPERLSSAAARTIGNADQLAVASVTWYELAWLAINGRITPKQPVSSWLDELACTLVTVPLSPAIAVVACSLSSLFSGDPADRQIYATALDRGWPLVSKDSRIRDYGSEDVKVIW
ncbi:MAG: type II toxin-antitoxin system VapC family toxin [Acidimicrobiaceae bacterium]|nr:type II toxin-antitoxin system VapC family toxin [Acidimicrobiaceae bacterium]